MAEPAPLRVVSWNVHSWRGMDGREDLDRFATVLREIDPDIVGLQEVFNRCDDFEGGRHLQRLADRIGQTAVNAPTMVRPQNEYGNALLTRLPVREVRHIDLSFTTREPRAAVDVDVETQAGDLRIIVTHLGLRPVERRFQVKRLIEAIENRRSERLVLMGDLNEWFVFGRPARWLHRHFSHRDRPATFPSPFPLFALDRIFVSPPRLLAGIAPVRTAETRVASDHLPLLGLVDVGSRCR